ncbi:MAG: hypothetical protein HC808_05495 [Candidatus Competibacteraceae bacterium]|nr:hypothetical protein [Candidatus Competibacteraceae bacterium]
MIYLTSRNTNHAKVIPFYEGLGMTVVHKETLPDDLRTNDQPPTPTAAQQAVSRLALG